MRTSSEGLPRAVGRPSGSRSEPAERIEEQIGRADRELAEAAERHQTEDGSTENEKARETWGGSISGGSGRLGGIQDMDGDGAARTTAAARTGTNDDAGANWRRRSEAKNRNRL
jgi:hypothetical protein